MVKETPSSEEILLYVDKLIDTASRIRSRIAGLSVQDRRAKTSNQNMLSNQYLIDVIADEIVQDDFSDFPGYVISEEQKLDKNKLENNSLLLVVDPVDGSTNASRDIGYWCFSAALLSTGKVIAGVVVDQVTRRIFLATEETGAYMVNASGSKTDLSNIVIEKSPIGSKADNFSNALICFNSHEGPSIPFRHLRHFGSSALAICDVASGGFDAYVDDEDVLLRPWDLLASEYIALKARCSVLRRDSDGLMAATGVLVSRSDSLISEFKSIFPHFFV